ncbi:MAG: hypothetical protein M0O96_08305 [Desulforhopalus sp.]|nr:hypothetical protein [Desulforhopalus sp.]
MNDPDKESPDLTEYKSSTSEVTDFRNKKELQSEIHTPSKFSFRWQLKKTVFYFIIAFLSIWLLFFVGRSFVDSIFDRIESNKVVHQDKTKISSGVKSGVNNKIILVYKNEGGELKRVAADRSSLTEFAKKNLEIFEKKRIEIRTRVRDAVTKDNRESFKTISNRIDEYADWYFAYTTTYKILGFAISSATTHTFETSTMPVLDVVALDVEKYLEEHFEKIVLKPEISDPILQQNYQKNLKYAHTQFLSVMANLNSEFQKYVSEKTGHLDNFDENQIEMEIDWASQFHKVSMSGYEKGAGGAVVGAGLTVGGALAGKAIGGAVGKAAAGKVLASSTGKSLIVKLSAPFVTKAVSVAGSAAAGGAAGTAVGGPAGTVVGVGVGLLVDYAINEGVELVNRDTFEKDTHIAIESFEIELNNNESVSLEEAVDIWFNDAINLLKSFKEK